MGARRISPLSFSEEVISSAHPLFTIHKALLVLPQQSTWQAKFTTKPCASL